ncbi:MAG: hypothetical protein K2H18_01710 [Muribaculaceae bacterium]|nr:hypothetical protein [Muribaculaceae bacterium]
MFGQSSTSTGQTMKVSGHNNVGGFAGYVVDGGIKGTDKFDYAENGNSIRVPDADRFTPVNRGVVTGNENVGGVVGYAENSSVRAVCGGASVTGNKCVGGVVGKYYVSKSKKQVEDCTFKGIIECEAADYVGGVIGMFYSNTEGLVHDCVNYSNIKGGKTTGGIIGYFYKDFPTDFKQPEKYHFELNWCVNRGNISGGDFIGGIIGRQEVDPTPSNPNYADTIMDTLVSVSNSMNSGKISGKGGNGNACIGGIVGATDKWSYICYCANHGEVYGEGQFQGVGGIAGRAGRDASSTGLMDSFLNHKMTECTNTATISSGNGNSYVGGIIGYQEEGMHNEVTNLHNLGEIPCKQNHDSGGIIGTVDHLTHIYRVVNQGMVSHGNATIGTHKTASTFSHSSLYFLEGTGGNWPSATKVSKDNFSKQSSFDGLDFKQVWKMTSDGPVLNRCSWRDPALK